MKRKGATKSQRALYAVLRRIEMEDKEAIEAITVMLEKFSEKWDEYVLTGSCKGVKTFDEAACNIIQTLASLGYVKLADEQKLPDKFGLGFPLASWNECEKVQYERGQQDMLSVDSEGCAYRRVYIGKEKGK
jgi:hypothetical protein